MPSDLQLYERDIPTKVFSCEIYEILKNTLFYRTPVVAASELKHTWNYCVVINQICEFV